MSLTHRRVSPKTVPCELEKKTSSISTKHIKRVLLRLCHLQVSIYEPSQVDTIILFYCLLLLLLLHNSFISDLRSCNSFSVFEISLLHSTSFLCILTTIILCVDIPQYLLHLDFDVSQSCDLLSSVPTWSLNHSLILTATLLLFLAPYAGVYFVNIPLVYIDKTLLHFPLDYL